MIHYDLILLWGGYGILLNEGAYDSRDIILYHIETFNKKMYRDKR